jgi:hypothetical protein
MKKLLLSLFLLFASYGIGNASGFLAPGGINATDTQTISGDWTFNSTVTIQNVIYSVTDHIIAAGSGVVDYTIQSTSTYHTIICNDTDGCDIILGEDAATEGQIVILQTISGGTGVPVFANQPGLQDPGPSTISLSTTDIISFIYEGEIWIRLYNTNN